MKALNYKQRVAKGAALLDEHYPNWEERVSLSVLDLGDGTLCILGQVYGDWGSGLTTLEAAGVPDIWNTQSLYGFNHSVQPDPEEDSGVYVNKVNKEYDWLKRRWTELILARRGN